MRRTMMFDLGGALMSFACGLGVGWVVGWLCGGRSKRATIGWTVAALIPVLLFADRGVLRPKTWEARVVERLLEPGVHYVAVGDEVRMTILTYPAALPDSEYFAVAGPVVVDYEADTVRVRRLR